MLEHRSCYSDKPSREILVRLEKNRQDLRHILQHRIAYPFATFFLFLSIMDQDSLHPHPHRPLQPSVTLLEVRTLERGRQPCGLGVRDSAQISRFRDQDLWPFTLNRADTQ
jgi:hypothetical protein